MAQITGLGGIFYVANDPQATKQWYQDKLGVGGEYGPQFDWSIEKGKDPYSLISHFKDNQYMQPSTANFMINLRVDDLDAFVEVLKSRDVDILDAVDEGYGKFAWLMDPNGVKIELWEQVQSPNEM